MRLNRKIAHYLKDNIDFSEFYIVEIIPQNKTDALVLLAPLKTKEHSYFNMQYMDKSHYYISFESMVNACIKYKYISKFKGKRLIKRYQKTRI